MKVLHTKTDQEILHSCLAEIAKATNELRCCRADTEKAQGRLAFCIAAVNELLQRPHKEIDR